MNGGRQTRAYTEADATEIQNRLNTKLDASQLSYRPAAQGTVSYVEGWRAISLANEVFGFNGWSSEVLSLTTDFAETDASGRFSVGICCMVRVHLQDGAFHDDVGYGSAENQKSKGAAYEKARKEAVTDALKRALRSFGERLGNCAYDKNFLAELRRQPVPVNPHPPKSAHVNGNVNASGGGGGTSNGAISKPSFPTSTGNNHHIGVTPRPPQFPPSAVPSRPPPSPLHQNPPPQSFNPATFPPPVSIIQNGISPRQPPSTMHVGQSSSMNSHILDSCMMLSEEDLLLDENFIYLPNAMTMVESASDGKLSRGNGGGGGTAAEHGHERPVYPLLPRKSQ